MSSHKLYWFSCDIPEDKCAGPRTSPPWASREVAWRKAKKLGWVLKRWSDGERFLCPSCSGFTAKQKVSADAAEGDE